MDNPWILMDNDSFFLVAGRDHDLLPIFVRSSDALQVQAQLAGVKARPLSIEFLSTLLELEDQGCFKLGLGLVHSAKLICVEIPEDLRECFRGDVMVC